LFDQSGKKARKGGEERRGKEEGRMPHHARPMTGLLLFTGVNLVLLNTITPVYDFVCFHPYWERRVRRLPLSSSPTLSPHSDLPRLRFDPVALLHPGQAFSPQFDPCIC
jgi:hypothetical protein